MYSMDDVISNRLGTVKTVTEGRIPFIGEGPHVLIVESIETYTDKKLVEAAVGNVIAGLSVRAIFVVESSQTHTAGSKVCKTWNLFKPSKFPDQPTDADRWVDFVCKLQGIAIGQHQPSMQAMLKTRAEGGQQEAQIARGVRINANGFKQGKPKTNPQTNITTQYIGVSWETYTQQDAAKVAATRAQLDQTSPYKPASERQQAQPQQVAPQQQFAQPTFNGTPMQNLPQFQPQQVAPQQYQVQPPMQQGYVQQPAQAQPLPSNFLSLLPQQK